MPRHRLTLFALILLALLTAGCQRETPPETPKTTAGTPAETPPPTPPIREDFEGEPKLSLFPRIGDYCPEEADKDGQALWSTYIDHVTRMSGIVVNKDTSKGKAFRFRGMRTINSVGFFSPLAVKPDTGYQVSFRSWSNLPAGDISGAGVLEFDEFLWVPGQYPKSLCDKHFQTSQKGVELKGKQDGEVQKFTFRTGPKTRMIHLVFFREGPKDQEQVVIDDIEIVEAPKG